MRDAWLRLDEAGATVGSRSAQFRLPTVPQLRVRKAALAPIADLPCCLLIVDLAAVTLPGGCAVNWLVATSIALGHQRDCSLAASTT